MSTPYQALPVINLPNLYVTALQLSVTSNTTLTIQAGQSRDSTNAFDMDLGNFLGANPNLSPNTPTILTSTNSGYNGLDTGTVAANSIYAVYVIADPVHDNPPGVLMSLSAVQPTMPFGYGIFRRIGWALTDGSANFISIFQAGTGNVRTYEYAIPVAVLTNGSSTVTAPISLVAAMPNIVAPISISTRYFATAGNQAVISVAGAPITAIGNGYAIITSAATGINISQQPFEILQIGNPPALAYKVTNALDTLNVRLNGWVDYL